MAELIELEETKERVILLGVSTGEGDDTEGCLEELADLVETAGAVAVDKMIQNREAVHPGTYLGKGKIAEVKERIWELDATGVVCDDELSPVQLRSLEEALEIKVMDRTMVILDIFAARANTREGKLQVELAQLKYRAARLVGLQKFPVQTGRRHRHQRPGEKKTGDGPPSDPREDRSAEGRAKEVVRHREVQRRQRERAHTKVAAIVGYTNAGKSTLLNHLTDAGILAEDKLFVTLDPTTRNVRLPGGQEILLTDTVGFIRKLPHHLIEAFKSTLEEARYSDIILHVVDSSNPRMDMQMHVVYETLKQLQVTDKIMVTVFNKADKLEGEGIPRDLSADYQVKLSAKTGQGIDDLMELLETILRNQQIYLERLYPYEEAGRIQAVRKYGELLSEEYREDGIFIKAYVPAELLGQLAGG